MVSMPLSCGDGDGWTDGDMIMKKPAGWLYEYLYYVHIQGIYDVYG